MNIPADADLDLMQSRAEEASQLLKTLGNAQRLRMLCLLLDGEMSVGQINEQLPELSQSALSQHLARLRDEGLVSTRREAQTVWYALPPGPAHAIIATLYGIYCAVDADSRGARRRRTQPAPARTRRTS
ncbi:MAG: metalloregulator ArsR/SmtB family transcription factor [Rhodanobacter lindaniclasticus]|nr:metalloregulator ArsR/SmtB family transcription factor [Rhodanobacter lindaniclasticus]